MEAKVSQIVKNADEKLSPVDLFSIATKGGEAATASRVFGEMLEKQKAHVMSMLAGIEPNLGEYAKLAGQAVLILKLQNTLRNAAIEGKEAEETLRRKMRR